jgi:3-methyladenine DNA glycosylase AlkD
MEFNEIMQKLEELGNEQTKKVLMRHVAKEPFFGVKVGDLKPIQKKIGKNYQLSLKLYDTGNSDAMYLAGLIADETKMSEQDLQKWVENAYWYMISEYTVAWIAAESKHGWNLGLKWIESDSEQIASAGWATLSSLLSITPSEEVSLPKIRDLMLFASDHVHEQQNRISYTMNGFIIAAGGFVPELTDYAMELGQKIGKVRVNMGETSCRVPLITDNLLNMKKRGRIGKLKKMARC